MGRFKNKPLSEKQKEDIKRLRIDKHMSYYNIFLELGISELEIREYCQEVGLNQNYTKKH